MKRTIAGLATFAVAGFAAADQVAQPTSVAPSAFQYDSYYAQPASSLPPSPTTSGAPSQVYGSLPVAHAPPAVLPEATAVAFSSCCDASCSDACGCGSTCSLFGDCCLGDPFTVQGYLDPCGCSPIQFGGWTQFGGHSDRARLSVANNDALAFNDHPGRINLHQQWFWAEKVADGSGGLDWGFRADIMYGTDAAKTQAFGNPAGSWDFQNGWDQGGGYGWAMPQLYGEVAYGDWSVIAGHFYTLVGYEVVTAPDNFFYSHALTMFNSEPFTHTGVLATYSGFEDIEFYGGWTSGWDTGFDDFNGGSSWLGGFNASLSDDVSFTYISTAGNFGSRSQGESGYSHSLVFDVALSNDLNYVFQSDLVSIDSNNGAVTANDQVGINQYLFYTLNDCWAVGGRVEWWRNDGFDYHQATVGVNYKPHANVVIRPEVRYDWVDSAGAAANAGYASEGAYDNVAFGVDCILTY